MAGLISDWVTQPDASGSQWQNLHSGAPLVPDTASTVVASTLSYGQATHNTSNYSRLTRSTASLWNPQGAGGYAPATIMWCGAVVSVEQSGTNIYSIGSTDSNRIGLANSGGVWVGLVGLGGTTRVLTSSQTMFTGAVPFIAIMTTRTATDHKLFVRRMDTGETTTATSASSIGSAGAVSAEVIGGSYAYPSQFRAELKTHRALALNRGLLDEEAVALLNEPWAGLEAARTFLGYAPPNTAVIGDLAVTLDSDTVAATASVPIVGNLAVTLASDTVDATTTVQISGNLAVTLADDVVSATGYPGDGAVGVLGDTPILLDDDVVAATVTVDLYGDLGVTLADDVVAAFVVSGSNGPFVRRRMVVLNG